MYSRSVIFCGTDSHGHPIRHRYHILEEPDPCVANAQLANIHSMTSSALLPNPPLATVFTETPGVATAKATKLLQQLPCNVGLAMTQIVNHNHYSRRGGNFLGIVLCCPNLVGDRLVYFDHDTQSKSWTMRDFLAGQQLDHQNSSLTIAQIEADANYDEFPPWLSVEQVHDWKTYLRLRTTAVFAVREVSQSPPNPTSGTWRPL